MNKSKDVIERIAVGSVKNHRLQNLLLGILIFVASFLLSFSVIFATNAGIEASQISGVTIELPLTIIGTVLIILCAVRVAITSILYASVMQRTHEYAVLQLVGATAQQIICITKREEKILSWRYIPIGLLTGVLCNAVLSPSFYLVAEIVCVVLAGVFMRMTIRFAFRKPVKIAASVSPIEAMKPSLFQQIPKTQNLKRKSITPRNLAVRYIGINRKKTGYTFSSLILSGVLMFVVFSVAQAVDVEKLASYPFYEGSSMYISYNSDYLSSENDYSYNDLMNDSPFTEDLLQDIEKIQGVTNIYQLKSLACRVENPDSGTVYEIDAIENILDQASFEKDIVYGKAPVYSKNTKDIPVVVNRAAYIYESSGIELEIDDELLAFIDTGNKTIPVTLTVSGFIENRNAGTVLFTDSQYLENISEMNCDLIWYITTEEPATYDAACEVKQLVRQDDRMSVSVLSDTVKMYKTWFHDFMLIIGAFVALVSSFSVVNFLNTCITNVIIRKYDYAILEAAGMTQRQLQEMQLFENILYLFGSFIGSCIIGIPFGAWICVQIANMTGIFYIEYQFPVLFILVYLLMVSVVLLLLNLWQKYTSRSKSVADRLKMIGL